MASRIAGKRFGVVKGQPLVIVKMATSWSSQYGALGRIIAHLVINPLPQGTKAFICSTLVSDDKFDPSSFQPQSGIWTLWADMARRIQALGGIWVVSAGNSQETNPSQLVDTQPQLLLSAPKSSSLYTDSVIVGAVDFLGQIPWWSRKLSSKLEAAPRKQVWAIGVSVACSDGVIYPQGTSYAAPVVKLSPPMIWTACFAYLPIRSQGYWRT